MSSHPSQGQLSAGLPPERDTSLHFTPKVPLSPHPTLDREIEKLTNKKR